MTIAIAFICLITLLITHNVAYVKGHHEGWMKGHHETAEVTLNVLDESAKISERKRSF